MQLFFLGYFRAAVTTAIRFLAASCLFGSTAQAEVRAGAEPYHIGVWYFTLWNSTQTGNKIEAGKKLYGRADPWVGVRDFAEGRGAFPITDPASGKPIDFAARQPLLGFYDLMFQPIVDAQIEEAASEGIEFFAFYWYFDIHTGQVMNGSVPVSKFFVSSVRGRMKFLLAPIAIGKPHERITMETWQSVVVPQLVHYLASPDYYRVGKRPVLIDYTLPFTTTEEKGEAYRELRQATRSRIHVDPLILFLLGPNAGYGTEVYNNTKLHPDGFTCFHFPLTTPGESYRELTGEWVPEMLRLMSPPSSAPDRKLVFVPCGSIGVDLRPWYGIGWMGWEGQKGPESRPYTVGTTPAAFESHLRDLKAFIDSQQVDTMNTLILYAWNEWGEAAASIEPSKVDGYAYADAIRRVFRLLPRGPRPQIKAALRAPSGTGLRGRSLPRRRLRGSGKRWLEGLP